MSFFKYSRLDIYLGEIQSDLSQVETLINDAADLLFASFTNVNLLVRVQQKLAAELASAPGDSPDQGRRIVMSRTRTTRQP